VPGPGPLLGWNDLGRRLPLPYVAAVSSSAAATLVALAFGLGSEPGVFAPFLVALVGVALRYGAGPALVTTATSALAAYVWLLSPMLALAFDPSEFRALAIFRLGVFAAASIAIVGLTEIHRQALQQLERSRRQLRAFVANDEVGMQVVDHDGRVTWADQMTPRLLGYEPNEYVGRPFADFHADAALAADVHARLVAGRPVENVRATLLCKDGSTQDVLLNSNTLLGDAGMPGSGVLVAVLPIATPVAIDTTKLAVTFLLERRRRAAAEAAAARRPPAAEETST
jgi:PAS domain S-box-containing protein